MALSDQEKERLIEEETVRAEARAQHGGDCCGGGGCCGGGHWHHRRGGFLKGLLVGVLAFWAVSALCRYHCGGMGYGHGCGMMAGCPGMAAAPAAPAAPNPKSK